MDAEQTKPKEKRRGHNEGTGYQRADGRWEWRISLEDGRRKSFYATTQRAARQKATDYLRELQEGLDPDKGKVTVKEYMERWLERSVQHRVRPATLMSYSNLTKNHILPTIGSKRLRSLTVEDINDVLVGLVKKGLSPTTANMVRGTMRTAFGSAVRDGYMRQNVAALSDPRPNQRKRIKPPTVEQARQLMSATRDHRLGMLFSLAIRTGLRQGELLGLTWDDIDLDRGELHVRHTVTRVGAKLTRSSPKTEQSRRSLKLSTSAIRDLTIQRQRTVELELLAAGQWKDNNLVFPSVKGTFLDAGTVTKAFQRQLVLANLPRQRFHDLRHCTASILLAEGMDIFTVKEILGHAQIALTANTYGHLTEKLSVEAANRIESALSGDDE